MSGRKSFWKPQGSKVVERPLARVQRVGDHRAISFQTGKLRLWLCHSPLATRLGLKLFIKPEPQSPSPSGPAWDLSVA